jgi:hypothetical protein
MPAKKPAPPPEPPKRGAPVRLDAGKRVNVFLDAPTLEKAKRYGNGNLSEGLRALAALAP